MYIAGGEPVVRGNRIYSNAAATSGGVCYVAGGSPVLENNLIYTNTAAAYGGGIYIGGSSEFPFIQFNTLYDNEASQGGGLYLLSGSPTVGASVIISNTASSGSGVYRAGGTLIWSESFLWGNDIVPSLGVQPKDPRLRDPVGGDFRLQADSDCIDGVENSYTAVDYRGYARPFGGKLDIGAYEFYTGTCFARVGDSQVYTTVQAAVDAAGSGAWVKVGGCCVGVETRAGKKQVAHIGVALTLQGGYTRANWSDPDWSLYPTTLDAQRQGRVIYIASGVPVTVEGLSIYNGRISTVGGGGIYVGDGSNSVIQNNRIYSNSVVGGGIGGGGIYLNKNSTAVQYNDIYSNVADVGLGGGGIHFVDVGSPLIAENRIHHNTASGLSTHGGGVRSSGTDVRIVHNEICSNTSTGGAENRGGGIYIDGGGKIWGNRVYGNTAVKYGGGACVLDNARAVEVEDNQISDNRAEAEGGVEVSSLVGLDPI